MYVHTKIINVSQGRSRDSEINPYTVKLILTPNNFLPDEENQEISSLTPDKENKQQREREGDKLKEELSAKIVTITWMNDREAAH